MHRIGPSEVWIVQKGSAGSEADRKSIGRYELLLKLYDGEPGTVWAGRGADAEGGIDILAVHELPLGQNLAEPVADAFAEAWEWTAEAEHDRVIPVDEVLVEDEGVALVSPYVEGEPLGSLLRVASVRRIAFPAAVALRVALDALDALTYLHGRAAEVRVKPAHAFGGVGPTTVIVGADGITSVAQPGVAAAAAQMKPWSEDPKRTAYAAPEMLEAAKDIDASTDLFSMGVLLWEMLQNKRLFSGLGHAAVTKKVLNQPIDRTDTNKPAGGEAVSKALADVVAKALNRNRAERFQSAQEMVEAIEATGEAKGTATDVAKYVDQLAGKALATRRAGIEKGVKAHKETPAPAPAAEPPPRVAPPKKEPSEKDAAAKPRPASPEPAADDGGKRKPLPPTKAKPAGPPSPPARPGAPPGRPKPPGPVPPGAKDKGQQAAGDEDFDVAVDDEDEVATTVTDLESIEKMADEAVAKAAATPGLGAGRPQPRPAAGEAAPAGTEWEAPESEHPSARAKAPPRAPEKPTEESAAPGAFSDAIGPSAFGEGGGAWPAGDQGAVEATAADGPDEARAAGEGKAQPSTGDAKDAPAAGAEAARVGDQAGAAAQGPSDRAEAEGAPKGKPGERPGAPAAERSLRFEPVAPTVDELAVALAQQRRKLKIAYVGIGALVIIGGLVVWGMSGSAGKGEPGASASGSAAATTPAPKPTATPAPSTVAAAPSDTETAEPTPTATASAKSAAKDEPTAEPVSHPKATAAPTGAAPKPKSTGTAAAGTGTPKTTKGKKPQPFIPGDI